MNDIFVNILQWIKSDWKTHPVRFFIEIFAWFLSISCSIVMAMTVPTPPLVFLYPLWITGCSLYAWAAYSRKSFGMLCNYVLLITIDIVGLLRMIL